MTLSSDSGFAPVFAPMPHIGSIARMDPKLPSKCRDVSWPSAPTPNSKSFFQSERPEPPPPPPPISKIKMVRRSRIFFENWSFPMPEKGFSLFEIQNPMENLTPANQKVPLNPENCVPPFVFQTKIANPHRFGGGGGGETRSYEGGSKL